MTKFEIALPQYFPADSGDRQIFMGDFVRARGNRAVYLVTETDLDSLLSDARYYTDKWGPDECPAGLKASARATIKAIEKHRNADH